MYWENEAKNSSLVSPKELKSIEPKKVMIESNAISTANFSKKSNEAIRPGFIKASGNDVTRENTKILGIR